MHKQEPLAGSGLGEGQFGGGEVTSIVRPATRVVSASSSLPFTGSLQAVLYRLLTMALAREGPGPVGRWHLQLPSLRRSRERPWACSPETVTGIMVSTFPSFPGGCWWCLLNSVPAIRSLGCVGGGDWAATWGGAGLPGGEEGMERGSHISSGIGFGTAGEPESGRRPHESLGAALLAGSFPESASGIFSK